MYSDYNRRAAVRRSNDEFLRRMLGGELARGEVPVSNLQPASASTAREQNAPSCDGSYENTENAACPDCIAAPSLAMVYSPKQCWRNLLEPQSGLEHGSVFAELIKPFQAYQWQNGREGGTADKAGK